MNNRIAAIQPSVTLGITSKAKRMKAEGLDVCSFAAGEPDFDTPQVVKSAAIDALNAGHTKYAPVPGLPQLRQAIADKLDRDNGLEYAPEQIVVSNGGKHSLFNVCMALCNPGDEVIIEGNERLFPGTPLNPQPWEETRNGGPKESPETDTTP